MKREKFVNNASTVLNGAINSTQTNITVSDGSVFPTEGDYRVIIDTELILVTARATNDLTVIRGVEGSTAAAHADNATIKAILTAQSIINYINEAAGVGVQAQGGGSHRKPFRLLDISNNVLTTSSFTWVNQGTSSIADDPWGGITVTVVETTGDWKLLHKTAPTPPYKITANVMFGPGATYGVNGSLMGVGWRESSTGKFVIGALETGDTMNLWRFTNPATFSAAATTNRPTEFEWDEIWMELEDDNTNLIYRVSMDGLTYYEVGVDGRTAFMAGGPNQVCWAFNPRGSANKLMHLRAWIEQ